MPANFGLAAFRAIEAENPGGSRTDSMCTLAIYFQMADDYPVVIAANRDEFLERPALPPTTLLERPHVVGGKDLRAGGTWLAINEYGLIAGLLNRRVEGAPNANARSRGLLTLDALKLKSSAEAAQFVSAQAAPDYNPFNLLLASRDKAFIAYNRGHRIEIVELKRGLHLLTNLDVDDFECPRISASYEKFAKLGNHVGFRRDPVALRTHLARLLSDHNTQLDPRSGRPNSICLHLDGYGTRSSSMIFMGSDADDIEHYFAPGPPCRTAYESADVPDQSSPK